MALDISQLSQDDLSQLRQLLGLNEGLGSSLLGPLSPMKPRQLHDLRLLPTKDDPRPTFFWSAESPRDHAVGPGTPFPRLMWHKVTNQEITVKNQRELDTREEDYTVDPPEMGPIDPQQELAELMAQLSESDRKLLMESMQQTRVDSIRKQLDALSPAALDDVLGRVPSAVEEPTRKRGRPRKIA